MLISGACACRPVSNCTGLHDKCGLDLNLRGMLLKQNEDNVIKVELLFSESCWQYWDAGVFQLEENLEILVGFMEKLPPLADFSLLQCC